MSNPGTAGAACKKFSEKSYKQPFAWSVRWTTLSGWVFLSIVAAGLAGAPAAAQQEPAPGSLNQRIQELESAVGLVPGGGSMLDRISTIEQKVFGQPGQGSLLERVERLRQALAGSTASPAASGQPVSGAALHQQPDPLAEVPLVNIAPPRFFRIEPPNVKEKITGDYFAEIMQATRGRVFRFKTMPIPVFITPYKESKFTDACIKGFEDWEEKTQGAVRFVQVDDPEKARIRVIWSHLGMAADARGCTLGAHTITQWKQRPPGSLAVVGVGPVPVPVYVPKLGPKYSVKPQVIEVNLDLIMSKHAEIRYLILQNVVAHELGHALGLLGHSPHKTDLMYPVTDEHSRLSTRDINTIVRLYEQKVDVPL
ncbi:MAG TPA: matrixin family metalloprotease [Candidatus Obscuribacterales bacterium]